MQPAAAFKEIPAHFAYPIAAIHNPGHTMELPIVLCKIVPDTCYPFCRRTAVLALACALFALTAAAQTPIVLENDAIRLSLDATSGQPLDFVDRQRNHTFLNAAPGQALWSIDFLPPHAGAPVRPSQAGQFSQVRREGGVPALELHWSAFGLADAPDLAVVVTVSLVEDTSQVAWHIAVEGLGSRRLEAVHFPRIQGITPQPEEVLAVPIWMGQMTRNPRQTLCAGQQPTQMTWSYPGVLSFQCMTVYGEDAAALYLAADDTEAFAKHFSVFGEADGQLGMETVQLPQADAGNAQRYDAPYHVLLGAAAGDWFAVAQHYRDWALEQPWARQSRLRTGAVAPWVTDTGLYVWNRGESDQVLTPALALQERTGIPVSVFWHWWHHCAYDIGFPDYLPPREGADAFRTAVAKARTAGVHAMVYMNQRLWGMTTDSWKSKDAARYAVKKPDGTIQPEVYNRFTRDACASMCMGTAFWRDTYAGLAEEVVLDLGVDAIYMDQACSSLSCYDPAHGHPIGGGTYWMKGFHLLEGDIRARCSNTAEAQAHARGEALPVMLAGEGCGEAWLPHLDLMLSLQVSLERYEQPGIWEPIPFFHAVYHGYAVFFGNYASLTMPPYDDKWPREFAPERPLDLLDEKFSQQFRLEQARAFVWGQLPTIANFRPEHFESRPGELAFVTRLAKLRLAARKFLLYGQMLRPPAIPIPDEPIAISRLSIYAGQGERLQEYQKAYPPVLGSAWRAPDGDVAVVLANVSNAPQTFPLALPEADYPGARLEQGLYMDGEGEHHPIALSDGGALQVTLAPQDARIYVFSKE